MDGYRSRKWILSIAIFSASLFLLTLGKITGESFEKINIALIVSYNFANAAQFYVTTKGAP